MKKTVSFLLVLILICCMAMPAYAENDEMVISLTVDDTLESYEVTIPPTITLDAAEFSTNGGGKTPLNVTINSLTAVWSTDFQIDVTSKNGFYLVNTEDPSKMIPYLFLSFHGSEYHGVNRKTDPMKCDYFFGDVAGLQGILPYNTTDESITHCYIARYGNDAYPGDGTYTDTLTFTFEFK